MAQLAVPHEVEDAITGVVPSGPALDEARARRALADPLAAIAILEKKSDAKDARIDQLISDLAEMSKLRITTQIEGTTAAVQDTLAGNKARRDLIAKVVLGILGLISAYLLGTHAS